MEAAAKQNKRENIYCTIGEVATQLDLPQHVLRFWETKFKQIKPLKRRGGHRYYSQENIILIKKIKNLLHEQGFTIKGAQKFLSETRTIADVAKIQQDKEQQDLFADINQRESGDAKKSGNYKIQPQKSDKNKKPASKSEKIKSLHKELVKIRETLYSNGFSG